MKKKLMAVASAAALALAVVGCSSGTDTTVTSDTGPAEDETEEVEGDVETEDATAAPGESAGFTELPIFEDEELDFINLSAVYFQPVPMTGGYEDISGYDLHLEADISALDNDYGYGVGDWVPYLTVDYELVNTDTGETAAEGTFMTMSASDGPHYGANIALPDAGTYDITFTIHSPEEMNYLLHTDEETGPGAQSFDESFGDGNITYTFEGWEYTPQEW